MEKVKANPFSAATSAQRTFLVPTVSLVVSATKSRAFCDLFLVLTSIQMLVFTPKDPGCPLVGNTRKAFWDGFVDERRMAVEFPPAPAVLFNSSANGVV